MRWFNRRKYQTCKTCGVVFDPEKRLKYKTVATVYTVRGLVAFDSTPFISYCSEHIENKISKERERLQHNAVVEVLRGTTQGRTLLDKIHRKLLDSSYHGVSPFSHDAAYRATLTKAKVLCDSLIDYMDKL